MWGRWFSRDSYYSHGILIPFVSGYLIWNMRDELKKIKCQESKWGKSLVILGVVIYLLSSLFRIYFSSGFSMLMLYSVDRIMIAKMLGLQQLGYYSIAIMARTYNLGIAHNFNQKTTSHVDLPPEDFRDSAAANFELQVAGGIEFTKICQQ